MRVTLGAVVMLGLAVAVAAAQPPARERAAVFKAPQPLSPDELPPVARGVADPFPASSLPSTPVVRSKGAGMATGPAWVSGVDPNVLPAAGLGAKSANVRTLSAPTGTGLKERDEPYLPQPRVIDRLKGTTIGGKPAAGQPQTRPGIAGNDPGRGLAEPLPDATAATPFRGTGTNGAPVYAGPPAYRWYGWGSVTPGANPLAPAGQYPKASANWYAITGATPGAFPVPVSNTPRTNPGTEPPSYGMARTVPVAQPGQIVTQPHPQNTPLFPDAVRTDAPKPPAAPESKFGPGSSIAPPMPGPAITPPPVGGPVSVPTITVPPLPGGVAVPPAPKPDPVAAKDTPALPVIPRPEPISVLPVPSAEPAIAPLPTTDPKAASAEPKPVGPEPKALPTSVTTEPRNEQQWKPAGNAPVVPGNWSPANGAKPLPTQPLPIQPAEPTWQNGGVTAKPIVARAQIDADKPDPVTALIKQMCQGRAEGVEIRFTGTKKLQVCFEIRTRDEAQKLVNDISKRPELTAYQIDFCVLVK
jgi:hypothetical protein